MLPEIHIFGITIYPYGLMIGIGLILAIFLFLKRGKDREYDEDFLFNMAIVSSLSGILGAKLLFLLLELPQIIKDPGIIFQDFSSGFVFFGGIIVGILVAFIFIRAKKLKFMAVFDLAAPSISLAQAFGRIGCFFAGCCYGKEVNSFLGVQFDTSPFAPHGVKLLPTQIFSSIGDFIIFVLLLWFDNSKKKKDGQTGALYLVFYGILRFVIEFFRGDPRGTVLNILSTSQFLCIITVLTGIFIFYKVSRKEEEVYEVDDDFLGIGYHDEDNDESNSSDESIVDSNEFIEKLNSENTDKNE